MLQQSALVRMMVFHAGWRPGKFGHEVLVAQEGIHQPRQWTRLNFAEDFEQSRWNC